MYFQSSKVQKLDEPCKSRIIKRGISKKVMADILNDDDLYKCVDNCQLIEQNGVLDKTREIFLRRRRKIILILTNKLPELLHNT